MSTIFCSNGFRPSDAGYGDEGAGRITRHGSGDSSLFSVFAAIAKQVGRDDLRAEFEHRASGIPPGLIQSPRQLSPHPESKYHHDEGCRLVREGKPAEAEPHFRDAIRLDPRHADAHGNLGVALAQLKRLPEAEAAFRLAVRLDPGVVTVYVNLATCLHQQGRHPECEEWARQAIQLDPAVAEPHFLLGCALDARGRPEPAEAALREAVRLNPRHAEAQYRLGRLLARTDKHADAEAALRESLKLRPASAAAWSALGMLLEGQERADEAVDCAREALKLDPESADLHNCLGVALARGEKFPEAQAAYREAVRRAPALASAWSNLGNALRSTGELEEAEKSLREALRLHKDYAEAHNNLAIVLVQAGRDDEALKHYDEAIRLRPDYPEARMNRSLSWLGRGEFDRGWAEYEWRFKVRPNKGGGPPGPRWDGKPMEGKTLLITAEQGLGDSVQFIRYAPLAKAASGATVVFDCPTPLAGLIATCPGVDRVAPRGSGEVVTYDAHVPLLSLPALYGVPPAAATAPVPYFRPDPARVEHWRQELAALPGLKVGISWQGSTIHKGDKMRSVPLARFAGLAAVPGVTLVSVQKGPGTEQLADPAAAALRVADFGAKTSPEMADAAALMMSLDLLVSVDTAVVHVAGALGRPVWVAVPYAADWRWLRDREDTHWYPHTRLFRQTAPGDWDPVFERLAAALADWANEKTGATDDVRAPIEVRA